MDKKKAKAAGGKSKPPKSKGSPGKKKVKPVPKKRKLSPRKKPRKPDKPSPGKGGLRMALTGTGDVENVRIVDVSIDAMTGMASFHVTAEFSLPTGGSAAMMTASGRSATGGSDTQSMSEVSSGNWKTDTLLMVSVDPNDDTLDADVSVDWTETKSDQDSAPPVSVP